MQDIDRISKLRDVNDTERPSGVPNPNLLYTGADAWHRLPIVRLVPLLYQIDLMTCFVPGRVREPADPRTDSDYNSTTRTNPSFPYSMMCSSRVASATPCVRAVAIRKRSAGSP